MSKLFALFAGLFAVSSALAAPLNHLVPPHGIGGYEEIVVQQFKDAFGPDVRLRAIVEPSFQEEYAVGTKKIDGQYRIFYLQSADSIWATLQNRSDGPLLKKKLDKEIAVRNCEYDIPLATGQRLDAIWDRMLRAAKPDESGNLGLDGTNYYFSKEMNGRVAIAMAWSPPASTDPGALVRIVETMRELCATENELLQSRLDGESSELLNRLKEARSN